MKKTLSLIKAQLSEIFSFNSKNKKESSKQTRLLVLISLITVGALALSLFYNATIFFMFEHDGNEDSYFPLVVAILTLLVLSTTIVKSKTVLFHSKDYEILQTLPVKPSQIIASKIIVLYLYELYFSLIIIGPALLFVASYAGMVGLIYGIIIMLMAPIIPLIIASLLGFFMALFFDKSKYASFISIGLSVVFLSAVLIFSMSGTGVEEEHMSNMYVTLIDKLSKVYPVIKNVSNAIDGKMIDLLIFFTVNIVLFLVFCFLIAKLYKKINNLLATTKSSKKYVSKELSQSSKIKTLIKKDLSRAVSNSNYFMNISVSGLMSIIMVVCMYLLMRNQVTSEGVKITSYLSNYVILIVLFCLGMSPASASGISIEGKYYWIIKSSPVPKSDFLKSKVYFSVLFLAPVGVIAGIVGGILFKVSVVTWIGLILAPIIYSFTISILGLIINLKYPKMEWKNETVAVKNSASVLITMLLGMVIEIGLIGMYIVCSIFSLLLATICLILALLTLTGIFYIILKNYSSKWLEKI